MAECDAASVLPDPGASRPPPPVLRRLPWPRVAPVDLVVEFPWLILHADAAELPEQRDGEKDREREHGVAAHKSPYKQTLRAPRDPPPSLSPAQRAARKMLQLQDAMEKQEAESSLRQSQASVAVAPLSPHRQQQQQQQQHKELHVQAKATTKKKSKTPTAKAITTPQERLQRWMLATHESEATVTATAAATAIEYSMEMEARIHATMHAATRGDGLWKDDVASVIAAELSSESVFGGFVATRRLAFDPPEPVPATSLVTAEEPQDLDRTTVHRPEVSLSTIALSSSSPVRCSIVEMFADEIRDEAQCLVRDGHISDALQALQTGIDRVLHDFQQDQDAITSHGFNYSTMAHAMATRLQRQYRSRHRQRVVSVRVLQQTWRRFRAHCKFLHKQEYQTTHARMIQRVYKKHAVQRTRERSAIRIQHCFRVFQLQKTLMRLHQACRLLLAQQKRKRERQRRLQIRMRVVRRLLWLLAVRRFTACWLQKRYRGWQARRTYATHLSLATESELARRAREDLFVEPRLARVMVKQREFYQETTPGRAQVQWWMKRPWLRWRRLRHQWPQVEMAERVSALCGIYEVAQGNQLRGGTLKQSAVGTVLQGRTFQSKKPEPKSVCMNKTDLLQWLECEAAEDVTAATDVGVATPTASVVVDAPTSTLASRLKRTRARIQAQLSTVQSQWRTRLDQVRQNGSTARNQLLWTLVFYPRLVLRSIQNRRQRREAATMELLNHQERVVKSLLRHVFRVVENDPPKYVCKWCGEGCGTAKAFYAHRTARGGCAEQEHIAAQEQRATDTDIQYHLENRFFSKIKKMWTTTTTKKREVPAAPTSAVLTGPLDMLRRVATSRSGRTAAHRLLDVAQSCLPPDESKEQGVQIVPEELLTWLLLALDEHSGQHLLQRLHAAAAKTAQWGATGAPPLGWVAVDDAAHALGESRSLRITRSWRSTRDAVRSKWRSSARYRPTTAVLSRVLAVT